jgi:hypothetical protein
MALLLADALLMLFITINIGILALTGLARLFRTSLAADPLGLFLVGLIPSTIYFNLLSFWLPVNYWSLLPLFALSCWLTATHRPAWRRLLQSLRQFVAMLRSRPILTAGTGILLLLFWSNPSTVPDSSGYHFMTIRWFESFPVIPGLGNLHGRMAFNPASFIVSAAWSFTGLTGQSIYPLNGLLTLLFISWILVRMLRKADSPAGWVYLLSLILVYRPLLSYMSSASSDVLSLICTAYPLILLFEHLVYGEKVRLSFALVPLLICLYAPLTKITCFLLVIPCLFVLLLLPSAEKRLSSLIAVTGIAACIYLPWIGRNIVLSGFVFYPLTFPDLFHPDWKIPPEMRHMDYLFARYSSRTATDTRSDLLWIDKAPFAKSFIRTLMIKARTKNFADLILLGSTIFSPLLWLFQGHKRHRTTAFLFWLTVYVCSWLWITGSMDFRFGMGFILVTCIFPLLSAASSGNDRSGKGSPLFLSLFLCLVTLYYFWDNLQLRRAYYDRRGQPFSWREGWVTPLATADAYLHNDKHDFPYRVLHNGLRLYTSDGMHDCLNADLPCQITDYGWIQEEVELRGNTIESGFKATGVIQNGE